MSTPIALCVPPPLAPVPVSRPGLDWLALVDEKRWPREGVRLTVGFVEETSPSLRDRIVGHMNAWGRSANVEFRQTQGAAQVRISRQPGLGHWSYVGTDILLIGPNEPTMNLDGFTEATPESEFVRVVRHETGHTLGFPHEHMRRELVARIDERKAIAWFRRSQGWPEDVTRAQVLTPLDDATLVRTVVADQTSIMCYQLPGDVTRDGEPILGGLDINEADHAFAGLVYPPPKPA